MNFQRRCARLAGIDARAHCCQWFGHPFHRPLAERGITGQGAVESLGRQQSGQQPHGGARIAQVQGFCRRLEAMQADTVNHDLALRGSIDIHPHGPERIQGGQVIGAFQKAGDVGGTFGQRPEHDTAMGNRLVAGYTYRTIQTAARFDGEHRRGIIVTHGSGLVRLMLFVTKRIPRLLGAFERLFQSLAVTLFNRMGHRLQIRHEPV